MAATASQAVLEREVAPFTPATRRSRGDRKSKREQAKDEEEESPRKGVPTPSPISKAPTCETGNQKRNVRVLEMRGGVTDRKEKGKSKAGTVTLRPLKLRAI